MKLIHIVVVLVVASAAVVAAFLVSREGDVVSEEENIPEKAGLIKVSNLKINQSVESPLLVKGEARGFWFFEADFPVKVYDNQGFLLGVKPARALSDWMTEDYVPFEVKVSFAAPATKEGRIILQKDNPSGLPEYDDELVVPVVFKEFSSDINELMVSTIYLSDSNYVNEPYFDCARTAAVQREVPKTAGVARAALEALLRGAKEEEKAQGLISAINPGVRLQSLNIADGVAKADFTEQLAYQVGGSCLTSAIRAQIRDTLKQFSTVEEVIISINGRTDDILQP